MIEFYCKSIYSRWHNCPATVFEIFAMEEYYLMWLARMTMHNVQKGFLLLKHFQTAEAVFFASAQEIHAVLKNAAHLANNLIAQRNPEMLENWILELEEKRDFLLFLFSSHVSKFAQRNL